MPLVSLRSLGGLVPTHPGEGRLDVFSRILFTMVIPVMSVAFASATPVARADLDRLLDWTVHDWRFKLGEVPGAETSDFDDSDWEAVDLTQPLRVVRNLAREIPHSWLRLPRTERLLWP
jgi:hypothetical protein